MPLPDISSYRGMSEPVFFSFSILKDKGHTMVAHAVILSSFLVSDSCELKIGGLEDDPRMEHFKAYVLDNHCKKARQAIHDHLTQKALEVSALEEKISALKRELKQLEKETKHTPPKP